MKNRLFEFCYEVFIGMVGVRVRKFKAEIMKFRIRGCYNEFFFVLDKLK